MTLVIRKEPVQDIILSTLLLGAKPLVEIRYNRCNDAPNCVLFLNIRLLVCTLDMLGTAFCLILVTASRLSPLF